MRQVRRRPRSPGRLTNFILIQRVDKDGYRLRLPERRQSGYQSIERMGPGEFRQQLKGPDILPPRNRPRCRAYHHIIPQLFDGVAASRHAEKLFENIKGAEKAKRLCGTAAHLMQPARFPLKKNVPQRRNRRRPDSDNLGNPLRIAMQRHYLRKGRRQVVQPMVARIWQGLLLTFNQDHWPRGN